jgi:hypothetical protein
LEGLPRPPAANVSPQPAEDDASRQLLQPTCHPEHPTDARLPGVGLSPFRPPQLRLPSARLRPLWDGRCPRRCRNTVSGGSSPGWSLVDARAPAFTRFTAAVGHPKWAATCSNLFSTRKPGERASGVSSSPQLSPRLGPDSRATRQSGAIHNGLRHLLPMSPRGPLQLAPGPTLKAATGTPGVHPEPSFRHGFTEHCPLDPSTRLAIRRRLRRRMPPIDFCNRNIYEHTTELPRLNIPPTTKLPEGR